MARVPDRAAAPEKLPLKALDAELQPGGSVPGALDVAAAVVVTTAVVAAAVVVGRGVGGAGVGVGALVGSVSPAGRVSSTGAGLTHFRLVQAHLGLGQGATRHCTCW